MNKLGFTLVELLAVVVIMGAISLLGVPALMRIVSDNSKNSCKYYEKAASEAARLYIEKESVDFFESGSFPTYVYISTLINYGLLEEYKDNNTKIIGNPYVTVTSSGSGDNPYGYTHTFDATNVYNSCVKK